MDVVLPYMSWLAILPLRLSTGREKPKVAQAWGLFTNQYFKPHALFAQKTIGWNSVPWLKNVA